jgi:hypothetical protein
VIDFLLSVVVCYFAFKALDYLFNRNKPRRLREGDSVQKIGDEFFIVRQAPEKIEVPVRPHRRHARLRVVK